MVLHPINIVLKVFIMSAEKSQILIHTKFIYFREEQEQASQHKSEVYHAEDCPLYHRPTPIGESTTDDKSDDKSPGCKVPPGDGDEEVDGKSNEDEDKNKEFSRFRQDSICSCGADLMSPEESKVKFGEIVEEGDDQGLSFMVRPDPTGEEKKDISDSPGVLQTQDSAASGAAGFFGAEGATSVSGGAFSVQTGSVLDAASKPDIARVSSTSGGAVSLLDMSKASEGSFNRNGEKSLQLQRSQEGSFSDRSVEGSEHEKKSSLQSSPRKTAGSVTFLEQDQVVEMEVESHDKGSADEGDDVVFDNSVSPSVPVPRGGDGTAQSSGILSRAVGSITSLGSSIASNSPNFSSIVDFSSGLFTRNQDERGRVKDVSEVGIGTPPRTSWALNEDGEPKSLDELESEGVIIDRSTVSEQQPQPPTQEEPRKKSEIEIENAVTLEEKAAMFKSLDGKMLRYAGLVKDCRVFHLAYVA